LLFEYNDDGDDIDDDDNNNDNDIELLWIEIALVVVIEVMRVKDDTLVEKLTTIKVASMNNMTKLWQ
jgi:hypothetical protein